MRNVSVAAVVGLLVTGGLAGPLVGCGRTPDPAAGLPDPAARPAGEAGTGAVRVLLASSLAGSAPRLAREFERSHPGTRVEWSAGASSALVAQVEAGAPADVVVTADRSTADQVAAVPVSGDGSSGNGSSRNGRRRDPVVVATNEIVLAVPVGNPGRVRGLADLARPELLVGLCAPQVPCGRYARDLLRRADVRAVADTEEPDARSLIAKIAGGDLDAGLVYRTDVRAARGRASSVPVPGAGSVRVQYLAVPRSAGGESFTDHLRGPGQRVLRAAGFGPPAQVGR